MFPWSFQEELILSLLLYKKDADLNSICPLFPNKDVYRHVMDSLIYLSQTIKSKISNTEMKCTGLQLVQYTIYVEIMLNVIHGKNLVPELIRIINDLEITEEECLEFLNTIHPDLELKYETLGKFIDNSIESVENQIYTSEGISGLENVIHLRGNQYSPAMPSNNSYVMLPIITHDGYIVYATYISNQQYFPQ